MQKNASRWTEYFFFHFPSLFVGLSLGFFSIRERFRRTVFVSERLVNKISDYNSDCRREERDEQILNNNNNNNVFSRSRVGRFFRCFKTLGRTQYYNIVVGTTISS